MSRGAAAVTENTTGRPWSDPATRDGTGRWPVPTWCSRRGPSGTLYRRRNVDGLSGADELVHVPPDEAPRATLAAGVAPSSVGSRANPGVVGGPGSRGGAVVSESNRNQQVRGSSPLAGSRILLFDNLSGHGAVTQLAHGDDFEHEVLRAHGHHACACAADGFHGRAVEELALEPDLRLVHVEPTE